MAILDADKEGFLRSETSLIQTIGRAARNAEGKVIMYADAVTPSMERAIGETEPPPRASRWRTTRPTASCPQTIQKGRPRRASRSPRKDDEQKAAAKAA